MVKREIRNTMDSAVDAFLDLGFTRYESLVLSILTAIGTSTVKEIHEYTDVPLPKVYQTLDILLRKNFIKQHSKTRPVQYTAYSVDIIVRRIQDENREAETQLKKELKKLAELSEPSFVGDISPFTGVEAFRRIATGIITNSSGELSVAMSSNTLKLFEKEFKKAKKRGVKLRSMMFSMVANLRSDLASASYKELGFDHFLIDLPIKLKSSLKLFSMIKKIVDILDYLGIIISDMGETVVILPLFPHETYFGIWICSQEIINRQLQAYNELQKIASKA
ncbi:MAG: hypothetical protein GF308_15270 [Candidatus Heimdallarchaeota archaeon]|nr:hypothetical protein [Candidatus Heimdallarchaeota archaeon]